jgi:hypothetical protein
VGHQVKKNYFSNKFRLQLQARQIASNKRDIVQIYCEIRTYVMKIIPKGTIKKPGISMVFKPIVIVVVEYQLRTIG